MDSTNVKLLLVLLGALSSQALETGEPEDLALQGSRYQVSFMATGLIDSALSAQTPFAPLRFENVLHNHGNDYNQRTGVFTVPFDGVYSFSASYEAEADGNRDNIGAIWVDDSPMVEGHVPFYISRSKKPLNIQGVLRLKRGQRVKFSHTPDPEVVLSKDFAHFAGFLVYPNRRYDD